LETDLTFEEILGPAFGLVRRRSLYRLRIGLPGANAYRMIQGGNENLPIPDLTGASGRLDRINRPLDQFVRDSHLDPDFWQENHAGIGIRVVIEASFLPAVADQTSRQLQHRRSHATQARNSQVDALKG
jgi:hypothetical protein